ncbi:hypothetical protein [Amycolatopsis regifaucium]|uniref:Uncharacterized protein n=1 Tax=Amycolatopsis regifaucium TaxID=546365 RepID=A0A154MP36_9PSEU|nr:hypothetical protein [Amycolatopsis regifaucium]KZB86054.1 hypothetical protein AVL48_28100 [Amycolatopsis regifaucium]OKA04946.1 hypothetical protein ATP06_0228175 [Amycolatopsis regifaucium]SFH76178.1 hypothetical protein SAMN04489731_106191 [Amycolatopsis regifaucium]
MTVESAGQDYLTRQVGALLQAIREEGPVGEGRRSFRLAGHLAAEGGFHLGDILAATAQLLAVHAWNNGYLAAAELLTRRMRDFGESAELVQHLVRLETGCEQGWLPREDREALIAYARRAERPDIEQRARAIEPLLPGLTGPERPDQMANES